MSNPCTVYRLNPHRKLWVPTNKPFPGTGKLPPLQPGEVRVSDDKRWLQIGEAQKRPPTEWPGDQVKAGVVGASGCSVGGSWLRT